MRLIECYIDNFGKLSGYRQAFSGGLNTLCHENGFGKSTLAAFIRAMLFGLDEHKKTKLDENDRKKYEPWQGGVWGGSLTLEAEGRKIRIERLFSAKAAEDSCRIFDVGTGKEISYPSSVGEALFGIDKDGFERTVFLSERQLSDKCENRTIAAKLSDLSGVEADVSELDAAIALLEDERKYYTKQSGNGELHSVSNRISELRERERELTLLAEANERDTKRLFSLESEIESRRSELDEKKAEASKLQLRLAHIKSYREALAARNAVERRRDDALLFFGDKVPEENELYSAASAAQDAARLAREISEEAAKHAELGSYAALPSEDELRVLEGSCLELEEKRRTIAALDKEEHETLIKHKASLPMISAAMLLAVLGALLGIFVHPACFLILVLSFVPLSRSVRKSEETVLKAKPTDKIQSLELECNEISETLSGALSAYGNPAEPREAILELRRRRSEHEAREELLKKRRCDFAEARGVYLDFVSRFPTKSENPLSEIKEMLRTLELSESLLKERRLECERAEREHGFTPETLTLEAELPNFQAEEESLRALMRESAMLSSKCKRDETELEEYDEITAELERLSEKLLEYKARVDIIKKTKSYLKEAMDNMNARYIGKTKTAFLKYVEIIGSSREEFNLDTSFVISKAEGGQTKPKEAYSRGLRDLYSFALRLALIDALYENELPFILIDDAFAYFDDEKLDAAKALLERLGEKRQIIYLTASRTRST